MKKVLLMFALALWSATLMAQETVRQAVFAELLGASGGIGVSYDVRQKGSNHWGYRFGLSYNVGRTSEKTGYSSFVYQGPSLLLESNYLVGRGSHRLELGLGMVHGILGRDYEMEAAPCLGEQWEPSLVWKYGYYCYANVGYRFQPSKGVILRAGVCPSFAFEREYGIHREFPYPYVSVGFAF